jgi:protoporphyrinogen/coproporphyrinogen III oxidase
MVPERAEVVVVGAGIAGLSAAWELRDRDVVVLEVEPRAGGRLMSEARGSYWLNFGGHVVGGPETATGRLLQATGVEAAELPGVLAGLAVGGRLLAGGRVETYPLRARLPATDRIALVRTGARLRMAVAQYARVSRLRAGESEAERRSRVLAFRDDTTFSEFLGSVRPAVDAVLRATIRRSSGEPEDVSAGYGIGYFQLVWDRSRGLTRTMVGGSSRLPEAIAGVLGDRVHVATPVTAVETAPHGVTVAFREAGRERVIHAQAAVVATPAPVARQIVAGLPPEVARALDGIAYGPYVVGAFLTGETGPMPYDGVYAAATPGMSFNMLFNTANVLRRAGARVPGGTLMVYAAAGLARDLAELDDAEVERRFLADLHGLFPALRGQVRETVIRRWEPGLPHPRPGRHRLQPALEQPLGAIQLAGDYLGTTYIETAIETGTAAARRIRRALAAQASR